MADPITWGLLNLIKKRVKGVQTTLDGLPNSFESNFLEIKNAISDINGEIDDLSSILKNVQYIVSDTNAVVGDIYLGNQYSEWIKDLAESGTNSSTYKDSSKMDKLIVYEPAILNTQIDDFLFKYIIDNSKPVGSFFKTKLKDSSGDVEWDSLTTVDAICKNATAYEKLVNDSPSYSVLIEGGQFCTIYKNYTVTESLTLNSSIAKTILNANSTGKKYQGSEDYCYYTGYIHGLYFVNNFSSRKTIYVKSPSNSEIPIEVPFYNPNKIHPITKFSSYIRSNALKDYDIYIKGIFCE